MYGNNSADQLAKEGSTGEQPGVPVTYYRKNRFIKSCRKPPTTAQDGYSVADRPETVIIMLIRSTLNRMSIPNLRLTQPPYAHVD